MKKENILRKKPKQRYTLISIRLFPDQKKFIEDNGFSASRILYEALKDLGFKHKEEKDIKK